MEQEATAARHVATMAVSEGRGRSQRGAARFESGRQDDWRQFIDNPDIKLVGEEPDFSEEGWARRRPKKK